MDNTYWHKQTSDQSLFDDLSWSRPENKSLAGKLAIIGGNLHGFSAPAEAYTHSNTAGVGQARVLLPLPVSKLTGKFFDNLEYAPGNPSGSFSRQALAEWLDLAAWADGTLIAGDLGRNSETAIVFESFLTKYDRQLTITKDAINYALNAPSTTLNRPNTTLVLSLGQFQKYAIAAGSPTAVTLSITLIQLVEVLHNLTSLYRPYIVTKYHDQICVAANGQVSTTLLPTDLSTWRVQAAAHAATWWLQFPNKPFESLTTAINNLV